MMDDRARYWRLKVLTVLGPTVFVAVGELVHAYLLKPYFPPAVVSALVIISTFVGAMVFSWYVFRVMERLEQERLAYKDAVLALKERERIAREMHDGVAQNLAVLKLETYKLRDLADGQTNLLDEVEQVDKLINQTYLEVRQTLYDLRMSQRLEEGFWPTIRRQVEEFERQTGIPVALEPLDPPEELWNELASVQILRIIQEALANVRKHARAHAVALTCERQGRSVKFMISDDGQGFSWSSNELPGGHYGLAVMRERAEAIGGRLTVESQPVQGTQVLLTIPVHDRGNEHAKSAHHASR